MKKPIGINRQVASDLSYFVEWTNNLAQLIFLAMGMMLLMMLLLLLVLQSVNSALFAKWEFAGYGLFLAFAVFATVVMASIDRKRRQLEKQFIIEAKK